jgi:hypothetical protein
MLGVQEAKLHALVHVSQAYSTVRIGGGSFELTEWSSSYVIISDNIYITLTQLMAITSTYD